jgi:diaminohydroxyphosphoribosylaminopyrimidine deaminase / 5-amino-6-(5-phosphoribosylamino)uracil reductase
MLSDEKYMARCLELAEKGSGLTSPNPMVGCVITDCQGSIIGEGYHHRYGGPHAEVVAIGSISDATLIPGATLYVSLEPCSHFGKTPPCADLIIAKGFKRVVIGAVDSNPRVAGEGIRKLKAAGIEVTSGLLEEESLFLNRAFFTYHEKDRPYVILKWAQTRDGFIDQERTPGMPPTINWITDRKLKILVHRWRNEADAILVGAGTVVNDNPELTTRDWPGRHPLRIVMDAKGLIDSTIQYKVFSDEVETWLYSPIDPKAGKSVRVIPVPIEQSLIHQQILMELHNQRILSLIIEGGRQTLDGFIGTGFWDEARVFTGNKLFHKGLTAPCLPADAPLSESFLFAEDKLDIYYNRKNLRS